MIERFRDILRRERALALLVVAFIACASVYNAVNPVYEAPDEPLHIFHVIHIQRTGQLPVLPPRDGVDHWRQEGAQPPLYYLVGAALTAWVPVPADYGPAFNTHVNIDRPHWEANRNYTLHTPAEDFPWQGPYLLIHLLRFYSTLLGAAAVVATCLLARRVFGPERPFGKLRAGSWAAWGAAAFVAFNPSFAFIAGSVSNDNLVTALSAWGAWLAVVALQDGVTRRRLVWLGLLMGLAALSKLSGLALWPVVGLALLLRAWQERSWRALIGWGLVAYPIAALVCGWWFVRNIWLYGDPTALNVFFDLVGRYDPPTALDYLWRIGWFWGQWVTFVGAFGWINVLMDAWIYDAAFRVAQLALVGLLVYAARRMWGRKAPFPREYWLPAVWILLVTYSFLQWSTLTGGASARLFFPAIPALAILFVTGWRQWGPPRFDRWLVAPLAAAMLALTLWAPFAYIPRAYAAPPQASDEQLAAVTHPLHITYGDKLELVGYDLKESRLEPGQPLALTLYWRANGTFDRNYSLFVHLFGRDGEAVGALNSHPGGGNLPTTALEPGRAWADTWEIPVSAKARTPVAASVQAGLYLVSDGSRLEAKDAAGAPIGTTPEIARVGLSAPVDAAVAPPNATRYRLGDSITLAGYALEPAQPRAGDKLTVRLWWRAAAPPARDYTVFVHLGEAGRQPLAQSDAPPLGGSYPTSLWAAGRLIPDEYALAIPPDAPARAYQVSVGMYDPATGRRLPVTLDGQTLPDGIVPLAAVTVGR